MINKTAIGLVRMYQRYISPYKGFKCSYGQHVPNSQSCSAYAISQLKEQSFTSAIAAIKTRLTCCHEVNKLFSGLRNRKWQSVQQGGFVDADCGGCDGCDVPDCGHCDLPDCDLGHSCNWFGADDAIDIAADAVEVVLPGKGKNNSVFSNKGSNKKTYTLVHQSSAGPKIVRSTVSNKLFLSKSKEGLDPDLVEISEEEAVAWIQKDK